MAQTAVVKRDEEPLEMLARLFRQAKAQERKEEASERRTRPDLDQ